MKGESSHGKVKANGSLGIKVIRNKNVSTIKRILERLKSYVKNKH